VSNAVQQMDELTQRNAASAEETAAASEELSAQSQNLMEQVKILSAQVGVSTAVDEELHHTAGEATTRLRRAHSRLADQKSTHTLKKLQPGRKTKSDTADGNGDVIENALHKKDLDRAIPMGEEEVLEHDEKSRDF
jgi:methyl-accepting chemotaxis protein